jgi:TolA-binding protein
VTTGRNRLGALAVAGAVALCAGHALAQTALDDPLDDHSAKRLDRMEKVVRELRAIVFQGRDTGHPVVVQPADTDTRLSALSDRLSDAQQAISKLNGELEVVRHDLDEAARQASDLKAANAVLQAKVSALEAAPPPAAPPPAPAAGPGPLSEASPPPPTPSSQFAAAVAAVNGGDWATAEPLLRDYVDRYGDGPRGPEAKFYLGKTLMARRAWADAATADIGAIRGWPRTRWAPEAVVDLSKNLVALNKAADACQALAELTRRYPKSTVVVLRDADDVRARAKCA